MLPDQLTAAVRACTGGGTPKVLEYTPKICGIYILMLGDEAVYVGQSMDLVCRANAHASERVKPFDRFVYVELPEEQLDRAEQLLIAALAPRLNPRHPAPSGRAAAYASRVVEPAIDAILAAGLDGIGMSDLCESVRDVSPGIQVDRTLLGRLIERDPRVYWDRPRLVFVAR